MCRLWRYCRTACRWIERVFDTALPLVAIAAILLSLAILLDLFGVYRWLPSGDTNDKQGLITAWATVAVALVTLVTAVAARGAANASRKAGQSQVMQRLIERYVSPKMHEALKELSEFVRKKHNKCVKNAFDDLDEMKKREEPQYEKLDAARREVHWFVKSAHLLRKSGSIGDEDFKAVVVDANGYSIWAHFVLPWSKKIDPKDEAAKKKHFKWADDLIRDHPPPKFERTKQSDPTAANTESG